MRVLGTFRTLKPAGCRMLLQILVLLPLTALGLRMLGFRRVYAELTRLADRSKPISPNDRMIYIRQARHLIRFTKRHGPCRGTCLSRSLVLWWLLRRQGIESDLRIGVRSTAGLFQAHAWVEYKSRPLNAGKRVHERFAAFTQAIVPEGVRCS